MKKLIYNLKEKVVKMEYGFKVVIILNFLLKFLEKDFVVFFEFYKIFVDLKLKILN